MRRLILLLFPLVLFGCTIPDPTNEMPDKTGGDDVSIIERTPQEIVDEFNRKGYDFSLMYQDGHYSVAPNVTISGEEIKNILNGYSWRERPDGVINLDGLLLDSSFAGDAAVTYSFFDNKVSIYIKVVVPGIEDTEEEKKVTFEDNMIKIGRDVFLVCSIEENIIHYILKTNYENRWLYMSLRRVQ